MAACVQLEVIKIITYMGHANRIVKKNCEQLFIAAEARGEGISAHSEKAKSLAEGSQVARLYSFPAYVTHLHQRESHRCASPSLMHGPLCHCAQWNIG